MHQTGIRALGRLDPMGEDLLVVALGARRQALGDTWQAAEARGVVFWLNLWSINEEVGESPIAADERLHAWACERAADWFAEEVVTLDGYGFTVNPAGSRAQPWHIDYHNDYASVFVPLSALSTDNATQFITLPPSMPADVMERACADVSHIDIEQLISHADGVTVSQALAPPFTALRLEFGTIHRGVANVGSTTRVMFYLSVRRAGTKLLPAEPELGWFD
jgi:hypothetical protein